MRMPERTAKRKHATPPGAQSAVVVGSVKGSAAHTWGPGLSQELVRSRGMRGGVGGVPAASRARVPGCAAGRVQRVLLGGSPSLRGSALPVVWGDSLLYSLRCWVGLPPSLRGTAIPVIGGSPCCTACATGWVSVPSGYRVSLFSV